MQLDPLQRDFLRDQLQLGARPKEKREKKADKAIDRLLKREAEVFAAVAEIEKVPFCEKVVQRFENELRELQRRVRAVKPDDGVQVLKDADKELDTIKDRAEKEAKRYAKFAAYFTARDAAEKAVVRLDFHDPQREHVKADVGWIRKLLAEADKAEAAGQMAEATSRVADADRMCGEATTAASDHQRYVDVRAPVAAILQSMRGLHEALDAKVVPWDAALQAADKQAKDRKTNAGIVALNLLRTDVRTGFRQQFVDGVPQRIADLKVAPGHEVIGGEIGRLEAVHQTLLGAFAGQQWRQAMLAYGQLVPLAVSAGKKAARRHAYDLVRQQAEASLAGVRAEPQLAAVATQCDAVLQAADAQASGDAMRFEEGSRELRTLIDAAVDWTGVHAQATLFSERHRQAQERGEALAARAGSAGLAAVLQPAQAHLHAAESQVGENAFASLAALFGSAAAARDEAARSTADLRAADALVTRAEAEMDAAEQQLDALGENAAAAQQLAAAASGGGEAIAGAVAELHRRAEALGPAPGGEADREKLAAALAEADAALLDGRGDAAADALKAGSAHWLAVLGGQAQHARYLAVRGPLEQRTPEPLPPGELGERWKQAGERLAAAAAAARGGDWPAAMAALHAAALAADETDALTAQGVAFDDRAGRLARRLAREKAGLSNDNIGKIDRALADARAAADTLDFTQATRQLDLAESRLDAGEVFNLVGAPLDADALAGHARRMIERGGAEALDELIADWPAFADSEAIKVLGKERFGIEFSTENARDIPAIRRAWGVLALVPDHAVDNPSLKRLELQAPGSSGGSYQAAENRALVKGRPNSGTQQKFGAGAVGELPPIERGCEPRDDEGVDYFDFSTVHEVGHSVDDRLNFMQARLGQAEFGGWLMHGADVSTIVDQVAATYHFDTPDQKRYVQELILGIDPAPLATGRDDRRRVEAARRQVHEWHAKATNGKIWDSQGDSASITLADGRIYHQAYPLSWVSYVASARARGITGYQFRAPGEWFAELYAAYRMNKLKPGHPSEGWLSTL